MTTHKLNEVYGFADGDIDEIAADVAEALRIKLRRHEGSNYHGVFFRYSSDLAGLPDRLGVMLLNNEDPVEHTRVCEAAPHCRFVLRVAQDGRESRVEADLMSMPRNRPQLLSRVLHREDSIGRGEVLFRYGETS